MDLHKDHEGCKFHVADMEAWVVGFASFVITTNTTPIAVTSIWCRFYFLASISSWGCCVFYSLPQISCIENIRLVQVSHVLHTRFYNTCRYWGS